MTDYKIDFVDELPKGIEKIMHDDLIEYEASHGIDVNFKRFALVLRNTTDKVCGVLNAFTAFSEVYIDDMWVLQSERGKGFNNINLVTSAFQAPNFYKKCGFTVEFVRENKVNPKLTKTFFVKYFKNEIQNQGII